MRSCFPSRKAHSNQNQARGSLNGRNVLKIPKRHAHFLFGFIQAGVTTAVASAVASFHSLEGGTFMINWLESWLASWTLMVPVVFFAAPAIQRVTQLFTRDEH